MLGFVKSHGGAETATQVIMRSAALRSAGIPTPAARPCPEAQDVEFDVLSGETGLSLAQTPFINLLEPVSQLHACHVPGLRPFDPFLRIRPRLSLASSSTIKAILQEPVPQGTATLHGDLHVGQFFRDRVGKVWIVDLDDLALGPPEADLANFTAHLATSVKGGVAYWAANVRSEWRGLRKACEDGVFMRFLRFALVRRHLKLREAGRHDFESVVVTYLRDSSNFSIR